MKFSLISTERIFQPSCAFFNFAIHFFSLKLYIKAVASSDTLTKTFFDSYILESQIRLEWPV